MRNVEGLTWVEWFAAATISKRAQEIERKTIREMREEWYRGVDPTEWAFFFSKGKKG
jgi:hypothetical protein